MIHKKILLVLAWFPITK